MVTNSISDFSFGKQEGHHGSENENHQTIRDDRHISLQDKLELKEKPLSTASLSSYQIGEGRMSEAVEITAAGPARFLQDDEVIAQMSENLIYKLQSTMTNDVQDNAVPKSDNSGKG